MAENTSGCQYVGERTRQELDEELMDIRTVFFLYAFPVFTGVVGNFAFLVLVTFNNRVNSKPMLFLISIAAADLVLSLIYGTYQINRYYRFIEPNEMVGHLLCQMTSYAELTVQTVLVFSLLALSVERFVVVCFPLRAKRIWTKARCRMVIGCVWLSAMLVGSIEPLTKKAGCIRSIIIDENEKEETEFFCQYSANAVREIVTWSRLCVLFAIPLTTMSVFYGTVIYRLWRSTDRRFYVGRGSSRRFMKQESEFPCPRRSSSGATTFTTVSTKWQTSEHVAPRHKCRQTSTISGSSVFSIASSLWSMISRSRSTSTDTTSGVSDGVPPSPMITPAGEYLARRQMNRDIKRSRKRVMKMLTVVVVTFFISWGPKLTLDAALAHVSNPWELEPVRHEWNTTNGNFSNPWSSSEDDDRDDEGIGNGFGLIAIELNLEHARTYAISLMLFHSTFNPIIYVAFSSDFRAALCGGRGKWRVK